MTVVGPVYLRVNTCWKMSLYNSILHMWTSIRQNLLSLNTIECNLIPQRTLTWHQLKLINHMPIDLLQGSHSQQCTDTPGLQRWQYSFDYCCPILKNNHPVSSRTTSWPLSNSTNWSNNMCTASHLHVLDLYCTMHHCLKQGQKQCIHMCYHATR